MGTSSELRELRPQIRRLALLLVPVIFVAGCASIATSISKHLAARAGTTIPVVLQIPGTDIDKIAECLVHRAPWCKDKEIDPPPPCGQRGVSDKIWSTEEWIKPKVPSELATAGAGEEMALTAVKNVLQSRVSKGIQALVDGVEISDLTDPGDNGLVLTISDQDVDDFLGKIETAVRSGAFDVISQRLNSIAKNQCKNRTDKDDDPIITATPFALKNEFLKSYYSAYFRRGEFLKIEADDRDARAKLIEWIKKRLPGLSDSELEQMVKRIIPSGGFVFGSIGDTGFVSRTGNACAFPGIQVSIDPFNIRATDVPEIDFGQVGADLVRVFFEATFDARHGLPGVTKATGVVEGLLEPHDPESCCVSSEDFQKTAECAARVEAIAAASTGRIVRGGGPLSLNNEAFAQILETLVGVMARKSTEMVSWCIFKNFRGTAGDQTLTEALSGGGRTVTLEFSLQVPSLLASESAEP